VTDPILQCDFSARNQVLRRRCGDYRYQGLSTGQLCSMLEAIGYSLPDVQLFVNGVGDKEGKKSWPGPSFKKRSALFHAKLVRVWFQKLLVTQIINIWLPDYDPKERSFSQNHD